MNPIFAREPVHVPTYDLPARGTDPEVAHQIVHDELMLDGNARLNLAIFVSTWMEPQATRLMSECFDKNMIDKDEYPRTAALEDRCVRMLAGLWHAPDPHHIVGCSTTGFPENRTDLAVLRIVVRNGFSHDLADLLLDDLRRALPRLEAQTTPARGHDSAGFAHGARSRA